MAGAGKRDGGGLGVAVARLGRDVVGGLQAQRGRTGSQGVVHVNGHGQFVIVDLNRFCGISGLLQRQCHHGGHRLTDKAHPFVRQRVPRRCGTRRAVSPLETDRAGHRLDAGSHQIGPGKNLQHARHGPRGGGIDGGDAGVRVGRTHEHQPHLPVRAHVVGELAATSQQGIVFEAANRLAAAKAGGNDGRGLVGRGQERAFGRQPRSRRAGGASAPKMLTNHYKRTQESKRMLRWGDVFSINHLL